MRIAVVGAGISGMTCAHLLAQKHDVTLIEANDYIGGHTATRDVEVDGKHYAVDTGFIVFNDRTYPCFNKLLDKIGIKSQVTEMSFSVVNPELGLEYNGHNLDTLFAQRRNILRPSFYQFIAEILRFNKMAKQQVTADPSYRLGDFLDDHYFSRMFEENYLLPMGAAIWSSTLEDIRHFPMCFFARFFVNHGLLDVGNRPQWYVIPGGSRKYIEPLLAPIPGENVRCNTRITEVQRQDQQVTLNAEDGWQWQGEAVIFACHSDQALAILGAEASEQERKVLSAMQYRENEVVLHRDESLLPTRRKARASWNYRLPPTAIRSEQLASVTYDMNRLQGLRDAPQFCVTLNPMEPIDDAQVIERFSYSHPLFNLASHRAQALRPSISGHNQTWFCGAYWHNGFHEDGVRSAVEVCQDFGCAL
ncbi:NAD(P)/FAD-dependent oxidoreductase [Aliagarivorans marinus]|uniref:NAD(P)/FAD-dependent oxidoreductase n=1 Tax=Aliagarivorans marinus TaxID=561965 RepID=UPI00047E5AEB|nr:FAD-dependent oxidoreductase [Aliagarivorans marinus]